VIGLGQIGSRVARRLIEKSNKIVSVWNRSEPRLSQFLHSLSCKSPRVTSKLMNTGQTTIITALSTSKSVSDVLDFFEANSSPSLEACSSSCLWIDLTSGEPNETKLNAQRASRLGFRFIDCAVSGGPSGTEQGKLHGILGADTDTDYKDSLEILDFFCSQVTWIGPVGSGHAVKAVNNYLLAAHMLLAEEALNGLVRQGIDPKKACLAISQSSGTSKAIENRILTEVLTGKFNYGFSFGGLLKDVDNGNSYIRPKKNSLLDMVNTKIKEKADLIDNHDVDHTRLVTIENFI
jgi:3-hydroxyisobutyrate dehydrogenase